jgi:preprotein translocase subunit SecE
VSAPAPVVPQQGFPARVVTFYHDVVAEMRKVTWPDVTQVRQLSIGVVVLSLFIGVVIFLMDKLFQLVLVSWLPRLFS